MIKSFLFETFNREGRNDIDVEKGGAKAAMLNRFAQGKKLLLFAAVLAFAASFSGCEKAVPQETEGKPKTGQEKKMEYEPVLPIKDFEGEFNKAVGWLNAETILFYTGMGESDNVYSYNLRTGRMELLTASEEPIAGITISPSRSRILIHSAPSTYESIVTVIDLDGDIQYKGKIGSTELAYEWNQYDENNIMFTAFDESWNYKSYLLDVEKKDLQPVSMPQPFSWWINKEELVFLDWDKDSPSLSAPVVKLVPSSKEKEELLPAVYYADAAKNFFLAVTPYLNEPGIAEYQLYDNKQKRIANIKVPQLSNFSGWVVPYYDYNEEKELFRYLSPKESGEADYYDKGFHLMEYNMKTKEQRKMLELESNEPLSCSLSGSFCLTGYNLEKLLNIKKKDTEPLIEVKSNP
ncbi:YqgU-like beta propeller domain-containing protein [Bacillus massilinigeriensis]|uniref:YqgU-like beta propeller domain-containing protein n=1 Tax=Bacillus mediterraneensis TaxID=1805474 RepID=UPI0008F810BF|nr:hypothetical protein [Bacillus mediterraneensis]